MTLDEKDIARRWCILNCWGWPADLPMPSDPRERYATAQAKMAACVRAIGITKCLEYWNSEEFAALAPTIERAYDRPDEATDTPKPSKAERP